ncbi:MAG TPA: CHAD domain-containing protein [Verrucomicrobiae bacterium]|nr:CHAD domain-containing protein [Verrucomicrobiae bacterium]
MSFRFKKSESPAKALRRVCRERVGAALDCLRKPEHPAAVHGARKEIKKLRALFRLVRGEIKVDTYRKGVKALRAAADSLAATRDARVMLKAFEKLTGRTAGRCSEIEKALKRHAHKEARRFRKDDSLALAERMLRKTGRRVGGLKIKLAGWGAIAPGLKQSYERGQAACRLAHKKAAPENFHDWRRHVKDLWFYFCLLHPICPAATLSSAGDFERLALYLGEDHDLFLLQEFMAKHGAERSAEVKKLDQLIAMRQRKLRAAALKLGSRLYAETPRAFYRRLAEWRR